MLVCFILFPCSPLSFCTWILESQPSSPLSPTFTLSPFIRLLSYCYFTFIIILFLNLGQFNKSCNWILISILLPPPPHLFNAIFCHTLCSMWYFVFSLIGKYQYLCYRENFMCFGVNFNSHCHTIAQFSL